MYTFMCERVDGNIKHDFVLATKNAVDYHNWFYREDSDYTVICVDSLSSELIKPEIIPVGSIEFVERYYKELCKISGLSPVNIPKDLLDFTKRAVWFGTETETIVKPTFCKNIDKLKGFTDIVDSNKWLPSGNYMFSEVVDINSEWRCFVLKGELLAMHNYRNTLGNYPDLSEVRKMIALYRDLDAYTLDIGVNERGTFIIEVHDFYSCGLYGFSDHVKLLHMQIASHKQKVAQNRK